MQRRSREPGVRQGTEYRKDAEDLDATLDGKIKANWRLPLSRCLHIVFRMAYQRRGVLSRLSTCFSTLLCTSLRLFLENRRAWAHRSAMSDDASKLRIRPGRIRDGGRDARPRSQSFINQVLRSAAKANGGPLTPAQLRGQAGVVVRSARGAAPALGVARKPPTRSSARPLRDGGLGSAGS